MVDSTVYDVSIEDSIAQLDSLMQRKKSIEQDMLPYKKQYTDVCKQMKEPYGIIAEYLNENPDIPEVKGDHFTMTIDTGTAKQTYSVQQLIDVDVVADTIQRLHETYTKPVQKKYKLKQITSTTSTRARKTRRLH